MATGDPEPPAPTTLEPGSSPVRRNTARHLALALSLVQTAADDDVGDAEAIFLSTLKRDVAGARTSARDLAAAVERLGRSYPDTVDVRRLAEDVGRVRIGLDLLEEPEFAAPAPVLEVIPDKEYDVNFFTGADDEGLGPRRQ